MGLKFFADHCIPHSIIRSLQEDGHEVLLLKSYIPEESPDNIVISMAKELDAILISLNGDFADIVTFPPANYTGIIAIQIRNHPEVIQSITKRLKQYLSTYIEQSYYHSKLFIIEAHRIRIKG